MSIFASRRFRMVALSAALCLLFADFAAASWTSDTRPSRDEVPVPKSLELPRYKNLTTDPAGDTFGIGDVQLDLSELSARVLDGELVITLDLFGALSTPDSVNADALTGYLDLDLDQDGTTGDLPWTDLLRIDGNDTGMGNEAYVDLFSYENGQVEVIDDLTEEVIGYAGAHFGANSVVVSIPLGLLGGDESVDVAAVIGTIDEATDIAPNTGSLASADSTTILLQQDRFQVEVDWTDFDNNSGFGRLIDQTDDSALLYFFDPGNWEMIVKVLDACDINNHYWVYLSGATTVGFTVTVTDLNTNTVREYTNPLGNMAAAVSDTLAFATCP
ncbi:MAG: hypothetical protein AAGD38_07865 [Acidobacteriota bacterium]